MKCFAFLFFAGIGWFGVRVVWCRLNCVGMFFVYSYFLLCSPFLFQVLDGLVSECL